MVKKVLTYTAVLIGTYVVLEHSIGAAKLFSSAGDAGSKTIKTLQGR